MPSFVCRTCGNEVSYSLDNRDLVEWLDGNPAKSIYPMIYLDTMVFDQWLMNKLGGECLNCFSIIASQYYPRNIIMAPHRKACTAFSSMGQSLGDRVMQQVIRDRYIEDNPDEEVIFLSEMTGMEEIREHKPIKVFWANLFAGGQEWVPRDAYWFAVTNEATRFARQGHYSRLWFKVKELDRKKFGIEFKRYVVVHLRNQIRVERKDETKNIKPQYVYLIFRLLQNRYRAGMIDGVVIVGNDSEMSGYDVATIEKFIDNSLPILDLRNRWQGEESLGNMASICGSAIMTIGRDSGVIQLAGAAGCPRLVAWDFVTPGWFPKVERERLSAWIAKDSLVDKVLQAINEGIK